MTYSDVQPSPGLHARIQDADFLRHYRDRLREELLLRGQLSGTAKRVSRDATKFADIAGDLLDELLTDDTETQEAVQ